jgi:hypothetical protein
VPATTALVVSDRCRGVGYESWLERDQVMWLDWDQAVTGIASQPFRLRRAAEEGKTRSHVPDYFAGRAGGAALALRASRKP